jgi:hypothetical protein
MSVQKKFPQALPTAIAWVLLTAATVLFTVHTDHSARAFDRCVVPPNTIAGLPEPRFFLDQDSYAWLAHTRDLIAADGWRLRHTYMDNAPDGRAMHWSHALIWPLRGMAAAIGAQTGWPAARSVELAGVWLMPLLLLLLLSIVFPFMTARLGWIPAALLCACFLTVNGLSTAFHPLQPDHHGLQMVAVIGMFACLQMGGMGRIRATTVAPEANSIGFRPLRLPSRGAAQRWFFASAVLGSLAIWLGATVWLFGLAALILSVTPGILLTALTDPDGQAQPHLWRQWARLGMLLSIGFYLLEYAPHFTGMRLEVNHPVYWLCWWGAGEILYAASLNPDWRQWLRLDRRAYVMPLAGGLALLLAPVLILFGPTEWYSIREPHMQRLHAHFIEEFRPAWAAIQADPFSFFAVNFGSLPLIAVLAALHVGFSRKSLRPHLGLVWVPALLFSVLFFGLMLWQLRWGYFAAGALVWLATLWLPMLYHHSHRGRYGAWSVVLLLLLNIGGAGGWRIHSERIAATADHVPPKWITSSLAKRTALRLGMAAGTNRWTLVGMASEAPTLYYFAGIRTVASYYWENIEGWRSESAFFTDTPPMTKAHELARERSFSHVYARPDSMQAILYNWLANPDPGSMEHMPHTLAAQLSLATAADVPAWIEFDPDLSAYTQRMVVFQTSDGLVGEPTQGHIFVLHPERNREDE